MPTKSILLATALSITAIYPANAATQMTPVWSSLADTHVDVSDFAINDFDANIVHVKNDKDKGGGHKNAGKGNEKKKGHGKPNDKKVGKKAEGNPGKGNKPAKANDHKGNDHKVVKNNGKADHKNEKHDKRVKRSQEDRVIASQQLLEVQPPQGRDMVTLLSAVPLALLGQDVIFQDIDDDRLLTYRNCPPGLAKKDPPCVPPGLAKDGVTYDQWVSYDDDELERVYVDRRDRYLRTQNIEVRSIDEIDDSGLLLNSDQVARLYDLAPAPRGSRYALIDGMPVLLEDRNYTALARINDMARVPILDNGVQVAPTAALTQAELMQAYRLPPLDPGYSYTVMNGEVLALENDAFETLQLIRIARAVF